MPELPLLEVDTITASPEMAKLLRGEERRFELSGEAYGGDISGSIRFDGNGAGQLTGAMVFNNIAMEEYKLLAQKFKHAITGSLSGKVDYGGRVELRLEDGMLQFREPFMTIESFDIQALRVEAEVKRSVVTLLLADLAGPEVKGNMTGTIQLNRDLSLSELDLKGTIEPLAEFYKNYPQIRDMLKAMNKKGRRGQFPFSLTGTFAKPRFRLL